MANEVYANNMEVACKAAQGKSICAFPDVCFTPPLTPGTPPGVPIPYPNTGMSGDTTDGSKSVKVSGQEVMLKNKSYFKQSIGNEAGSAPKKGVVTSTNKGKVYFTAWSMDVKFEGENVVRNLDLTTHNHNPSPGNSPPWTYLDRMAMGQIPACTKEREAAEKACGDTSKKAKCPSCAAVKKAEKASLRAKARWGEGSRAHEKAKAKVKSEYGKFANKVQGDKCHKALRCFLAPYIPKACCPGQTGHHVIDAASFLEPGSRSACPQTITGWKKYDVDAAPCVCVEGPNQTTATHGEMHVRQGVVALHEGGTTGKWTRKKATKAGARAIQKTFPASNCSEACLEGQLNAYHDKAKTTADDKPINAPASMTGDAAARNTARAEMGVPSPGVASSR